MTVGIFFDSRRNNGGSYQMSFNNLLTFIKNFKKNKTNYKILTNEKNTDLDKLNIKYIKIEIILWDYFFLFFQNFTISKYFLNKFDVYSPFEKKLFKKNISLVIFFFTSWKSFLLRKTQFTVTIMDTSHIDFKGIISFKEISLSVILFREYLYKNILPLAYRVITESKDLKKKIIKLYHVKTDSIIPIPNLKSALLVKNTFFDQAVKKKYNINKKFFFYPAQFWEHKNHIIILQSIQKLKLKKKEVNFIFCGSDKGNLKFIKKKILEYGIEENVKILNYVKDDELVSLYNLCEALIFPSYFGPTNIPPVEAWSLNVPVAYSSLNKNHGGKAAIYFSPKSSDQLVNALIRLESFNIRKKLIINGKRRLKNIKKENVLGHKKFASDISFLDNK